MAYQCINRSLDRANVLPSGKAGAALAAGDLVYMDSSGNWQIAAAGSHLAEGIMESAALIYERVSPIKIGDFDGWSSQTIGAKAYLSITGTTGNTITATKPVGVQVQEIGFFSSATTLRVGVSAAAEEGESAQIAIYGSDGKFKQAYATIDLAVAATVADDIVAIKPGSYTLSGAVNITKAGVHIMGTAPGVEIVGAAGADYCFKTVLGALGSTKTVKFSNFYLDHGDDATQIGIEIANVSATGRINVEVTDVSTGSDGGNSIQSDHSVTTSSIRLYVTGGTFEGPVNCVVNNTDDRIRFEGSTLRGGLVTGTVNVAMEIELWNCKVLHQGVTGGHSSQLLYAAYCLSETDANPNVYAALDTSDLAGSHTESLLFPAS